MTRNYSYSLSLHRQADLMMSLPDELHMNTWRMLSVFVTTASLLLTGYCLLKGVVTPVVLTASASLTTSVAFTDISNPSSQVSRPN